MLFEDAIIIPTQEERRGGGELEEFLIQTLSRHKYTSAR